MKPGAFSSVSGGSSSVVLYLSFESACSTSSYASSADRGKTRLFRSGYEARWISANDSPGYSTEFAAAARSSLASVKSGGSTTSVETSLIFGQLRLTTQAPAGTARRPNATTDPHSTRAAP